MRQLGQILVEEALLSEADLAEAVGTQQANGGSLGRILVDKGYITERDLVHAVATQIGMEFVDLAEVSIDPMAVTSIGETIAKRYHAFPYGYTDDGRLIVAMSDPANVFAIDDIRTITSREVKAVVATKDDIEEAIKRNHSMTDDIEALTDEFAIDEEDVSLTQLTEVSEEAPIVKFVNLLISQAVNDGASDIHIEPGERDLRIRYRIDGVLKEVMRSPKNVQSGVISRLKIMADVDISERRRPQDGRISVSFGGKGVDLRFSTLPTVYGEKIVMRILDKSSILLTLEDLGFLPDNLKRYAEAYTKPYGMILVTGPTGSGKSTTLYATLNKVSRPEINIITVEDPVEYRLPNINQVQVNNKAGLTFASALRSILRQDPDVVLVGEMRDHETGQIGIEAALTGHLVLSTLHTNDAASAVTRLTEMDIEPFLVGSATDAVLAQRLARKVCSSCTIMERPEAAILIEAGFSPEVIEERPEIPKIVGCKKCSNTGYKGRLAVHEVMTVTEEIQRLCVKRVASDEIKALAIEQGMTPLREDGLQKVLMGRTTIEEIARVVA